MSVILATAHRRKTDLFLSFLRFQRKSVDYTKAGEAKGVIEAATEEFLGRPTCDSLSYDTRKKLAAVGVTPEWSCSNTEFLFLYENEVRKISFKKT